MNVEIKCKNCTYRNICENAYGITPNPSNCGKDFGFALDYVLELKTNGDVIRESNNDLARFLMEHTNCNNCMAYKGKCTDNPTKGECIRVWENYLNQPIKDRG